MTAVPAEFTGRYACPACERRFAELSEKKAHLREQHADTRKAKR